MTGAPGTGKTALALGIAQELGTKVRLAWLAACLWVKRGSCWTAAALPGSHALLPCPLPAACCLHVCPVLTLPLLLLLLPPFATPALPGRSPSAPWWALRCTAPR